jgi:hypothetical protein
VSALFLGSGVRSLRKSVTFGPGPHRLPGACWLCASFPRTRRRRSIIRLMVTREVQLCARCGGRSKGGSDDRQGSRPSAPRGVSDVAVSRRCRTSRRLYGQDRRRGHPHLRSGRAHHAVGVGGEPSGLGGQGTAAIRCALARSTRGADSRHNGGTSTQRLKRSGLRPAGAGSANLP